MNYNIRAKEVKGKSSIAHPQFFERYFFCSSGGEGAGRGQNQREMPFIYLPISSPHRESGLEEFTR